MAPHSQQDKDLRTQPEHTRSPLPKRMPHVRTQAVPRPGGPSPLRGFSPPALQSQGSCFPLLWKLAPVSAFTGSSRSRPIGHLCLPCVGGGFHSSSAQLSLVVGGPSGGCWDVHRDPPPPLHALIFQGRPGEGRAGQNQGSQGWRGAFLLPLSPTLEELEEGQCCLTVEMA